MRWNGAPCHEFNWILNEYYFVYFVLFIIIACLQRFFHYSWNEDHFSKSEYVIMWAEWIRVLERSVRAFQTIIHFFTNMLQFLQSTTNIKDKKGISKCGENINISVTNTKTIPSVTEQSRFEFSFKKQIVTIFTYLNGKYTGGTRPICIIKQ